MKIKVIVFAFTICNLIICNLLIAQNITNTLGTSGVFTLKDNATTYLSLSQSTGDLSLNRSLVLPNTTGLTTGLIYKGTERFLHNYGTSNLFIGINSGNFSMIGSFNTCVGLRTLFSNTTGRWNSAFGSNSLENNNIGIHNAAFGLYSLNENTSGSWNSAFGSYTLQNNNTGNYNLAFGHYTLRANSSGNENTAVGCQSLFSNTTGAENTAIGFQSLYSNTINSGNTALGWKSLYSSTGWQNTAVGHHSLNSNTTGNYNTALGYNAGSTITTGLNLTCIGIDANPTTPTATDQITLGNQFVASLRCNVQTITSLSDARDKKNISELSLGLDFITKLHPRQFNWDKREWYDDNVSDGSKMKDAPTAGFIAQELDSAQTTAGADWLNLVLKDNPEKWEATYGNLLPVMVKAIQELKAENDELKSSNERLAAEVESLSLMGQKLAKLERMINELSSVKNTSLSQIK